MAKQLRERFTEKERQDMRDWLAEFDEDMLVAEGFDDAFMGIVDWASVGAVAVYDEDACYRCLMDDHDMSYEQATEHFGYNTQGVYVGGKTPMFLTFWGPAREAWMYRFVEMASSDILQAELDRRKKKPKAKKP